MFDVLRRVGSACSKLAPLLILLAVTPLVASCGSKKENKGALVGWAIAGHPLVGATVEAVDASGKVIATSPSKTLRTGTWYLPMDGPPKTFTVVVSGGNDSGRPFTGELKNVLRDFDFKNPQTVHVNPATTLTAAYLGAHPDATKDEAVKAVASFLRIPDSFNLESDLRASDRFFSGEEFMKEAKGGGGVGPFVDKLERDLDAGKTHAFLHAPANQVARSADLSPFQIATGSLSAVGTVVGMIRGGEQTDAIASIETNLSALETQVTNLNADVTSVLAVVDKLLKITVQDAYSTAMSGTPATIVTELSETNQGAIFPALQNLLQTVSAGQCKQTYDPYNYSDPYSNWIAPCESTPPTQAQINASAANFVSAMQGNEDTFDNAGGGGALGIYTALVGGGGATAGGLYEYSNYAGTSAYRFITPAIQQQAAYAVNYWLGVQAEAVAVAGAYESAENTDSSGNPITPAPVNMHFSLANADFVGQNVTDAQKACVPNSSDPTWTITSSNDVLNELNASRSCFTLLPDDSTTSSQYTTIGTYPMTLVDQATGLMWEDGGGQNPDFYDPANFVSSPSQTGFPDPSSVPSPGWSIPTLSQYEALASLNEGKFNVSTEYTSGLDMLANYAQLPFFQNILADTQDPTKTEPQDYIQTFWTNDSSNCEAASRTGQVPNIAWVYNLCLAGVYDLVQNKAFVMCANAASDGGDSSCVNLMNQVDYVGFTLFTDNTAQTDAFPSYNKHAVFGGTHANDAADYLLVRTVGKGEEYGGS